MELAFDYRPANDLKLGLNMFSYEWNDIIVFVADPGGTTRTARNVGEQTGAGVEMEVDWRPFRKLQLIANYAHQQSTNETAGAPAGNAPRNQLYMRATWKFRPDWSLTAQANRVMDRRRAPGDSRPKIDDYTLVDLVVRRERVKRDWDLALIVKNLFDAEAREPSPQGDLAAPIPNDLPLAGRAVFGEVRYYF